MPGCAADFGGPALVPGAGSLIELAGGLIDLIELIGQMDLIEIIS